MVSTVISREGREKNQALQQRDTLAIEMGTAMSMDLDADWEEALDRYEKNVLLQISQLSITAEDEEEDPTSDSGSEQSSECVCCQTQYPPSEMIEAKCCHFYCNTCLTALFERSLHDDSFCPPRCCTTSITLQDAEGFISHKLVAKYERRVEELLDPDKTYCSDPTCSRYIPQNTTKSHRAVCKCKCGVKTCRKCKQKAHGLLDNCVRHFDSLLENLAKVEGWKRCPHCSRLTELEKGCYHIR